MFRFTPLACVAACALAPAAAPVPRPAAAKNLIVNGSFEDGPTCDRIRGLPAGSGELPGWTVTRGSVDYVGPFWQHRDGKRSLDLHGSPGFGGVKQTVGTTPGAKHTLTFYLSGTPGAAVPKKSMAVEIDGNRTVFTCDSTGSAETKWVRHALAFTPTGPKTAVEFYSLETEDPNCGPALDDVRLVRE